MRESCSVEIVVVKTCCDNVSREAIRGEASSNVGPHVHHLVAVLKRFGSPESRETETRKC